MFMVLSRLLECTTRAFLIFFSKIIMHMAGLIGPKIICSHRCRECGQRPQTPLISVPESWVSVQMQSCFFAGHLLRQASEIKIRAHPSYTSEFGKRGNMGNCSRIVREGDESWLSNLPAIGGRNLLKSCPRTLSRFRLHAKQDGNRFRVYFCGPVANY